MKIKLNSDYIYKFIGHYILDRCPWCGRRLLINEFESEWCPDYNCGYWAEDGKIKKWDLF